MISGFASGRELTAEKLWDEKFTGQSSFRNKGCEGRFESASADITESESVVENYWFKRNLPNCLVHLRPSEYRKIRIRS